MKQLCWTAAIIFGGTMNACASFPPGPVAPERSHTMEAHGEKRNDPYFWMKERENPEVVSYIQSENSYADQILAGMAAEKETLFQEMRSRMKEDESSYPSKDGAYLYFQRFETGKEYPIYARRKNAPNAAEEILLDVNELARGHEYFHVPFPEWSPDHTKIVYAADSQGRRFYDLHVVDLATGRPLETIPNTTGDVAWANDSATFFYLKQHPDTLRSQYAFRHKLGERRDKLIFEEKDETFGLDLIRARTGAVLFLASSATLSSEWRYLDANKPDGKFRIFLARERNHEYTLDDGGEAFYVTTNWQAQNFRLMKAPRQAGPKSKWQEVIPNRADILLENAEFFRGFYAVHERKGGLTRLRIVNRKDNSSRDVSVPDPAYVISGAPNLEYDTQQYRYLYESMVCPETVYDYDLASSESLLRKKKATPNLDVSQYVSERRWATARDGVQVPISIVYKKTTARDGRAPLYQYAYGSYGSSMEPYFDANVFSLLDRGFVYAVAHVRGGSEMGRHWYDDGKLLKKRNTFTDFIDATEFLVQQAYADPRRVFAEGESAGGLLMGAILNFRPDLYRGVHAGVPFVDVLTTMLDESIPLTTGEYDEWGDPRRAEYYQYMRTYSPYDNVEPKAYPTIFITSGLHDSQVQYWEPTKWAAKLRKLSTSGLPILLRTEMEAGHGGSSGRFEQLKETAEEYAFFLWADKNG